MIWKAHYDIFKKIANKSPLNLEGFCIYKYIMIPYLKHPIPKTLGPEWQATQAPILNGYTFLGFNSSFTFSINFLCSSMSSPYPTYTSLSEKLSPTSDLNCSINVDIIFLLPLYCSINVDIIYLLPLTWVFCLTNPSSIFNIGFILRRVPIAALVPDILPPFCR